MRNTPNLEDVALALSTARDDRLLLLRLAPAIVERIDAFTKRLEEEAPSMRRSGRNGALRVLLSRALDAEEARAAEPGEGGP